MPRNPGFTKKTGKQRTAAKTSQGKAEDEPKSNDPKKLEEYLKCVLLGNKTRRGKKGQCPQLPKLEGTDPQQRTDAFNNQSGEVIDYCTTELPVEKKINYLLNVARTPEVLADEFHDSLVDEARKLLLSRAFQAMADCLVREAKKPESRYSESTFVQYLFKHADSLKISEEEWELLLTACKEELLDLFKYIISICGKWFSWTCLYHTIQIRHLYQVQNALVSIRGMHGLALLLRDEVKQAENKPGSFFSNTELGSLLSLNTVIHRNGGIQPCSVKNIFSEVLRQSINTLPPSEVIQTNKIHLPGITELVPKVLATILNSDIEFNQESVFAWMAAVINSNSSNRSQDPQDRSHDAYMMTFSTVLLHTWKVCSKNLTKSSDFRLYCSRECSMYPTDEVSLTGKEIQIVGESSCSPLTAALVAKKLFLCCLRAVGVCLLPVLHRYREQRIPILSEQHNPDDLQKLLRVDEVTLWDEDFHKLVAQLYVEQCKLLLQLLDPIENRESSAADFTRNNLSLIPAFFVVGMNDWIHLLHQAKQCILDTFKDISGMESCLNLCIRLLQWRHFPVIFSPHMGFNLIRTLHILGPCIDKREWVMDKLIQEIEQVLPSMLTIYTKDDGNDYNVWAYIACFINNCEFKPEFQKILHEKCETKMLEEFVESFLRKLQILVNECDSVLKNPIKNSETKALLHWLNHHVILLSTLTNDELIHPMFWAPSPKSQTNSTLRLMADFLSHIATPRSYDSVDFTRRILFKRVLGRGVQILLKSVKIFRPREDLSEIYDHLKLLLHDQFFCEKSFTNMMDMIKYATAINSKNQKEARMEDESWMTVCLNSPLDEDALLEAFHTRLEQLRLITAPLLQYHSFKTDIGNGTIKPEIQTNLESERQRWKRISLFNPSSAAFLVIDTERVDVMRCAMSGPVGTPYSRGLFVFDIFCPADYPSVPPRVKLASIEDGTAFFGSPMENNEVSLASLPKELRHGITGDWSILKVLHLLWNMMLTAMKESTQDGAKCTKERPRRLCQIRAQTVRHAMLEPLKKPPVGLEEVVRPYFDVQQQALLKQCARWVKDCVEEEIKTCVRELYTKLQESGSIAPLRNICN